MSGDRCPRCAGTLTPEPIVKDPPPGEQRAPAGKVALHCVRCGYSTSQSFRYRTVRTCPTCGTEEQVLRVEDIKSKEGFHFHCGNCDRDFPGRWE